MGGKEGTTDEKDNFVSYDDLEYEREEQRRQLETAACLRYIGGTLELAREVYGKDIVLRAIARATSRLQKQDD